MLITQASSRCIAKPNDPDSINNLGEALDAELRVGCCSIMVRARCAHV